MYNVIEKIHIICTILHVKFNLYEDFLFSKINNIIPFSVLLKNRQ